MKTTITKHWIMKETTTDQGLCVFAVPSTNVCSNMRHLNPQIFTPLQWRSKSSYTQRPTYFTFAVPLRTLSLEAFAAPADSLGAGATAEGRLRPSRKLCQKIRIGLATKTDE